MEIKNKLIIAGLFVSLILVLASVMPGVAVAQYYGCTYHAYQMCAGNSLYWYDSCGNQQGYIQPCPNYYSNCAYHASQKCVGGNALYWYDSCGNQQELAQYCQNSCINNSCGGNGYNNYNTNYNVYSNCTYHAYRLCAGNSIFWYDSCDNQQDLYYSCGAGQTCRYGQCGLFSNAPAGNYTAHYETRCSGGSLYWYDSLGVFSGLYKNCQDNDSCTIDACSGNKCSNTIKCDGSTCAIGSADYTVYCAISPSNNPNHCGNGVCDPSLGETAKNCSGDCGANTNTNTNTNAAKAELSASFFTRQDSSTNQWQKETEIGHDSQIYFMISVTNNSTIQVDNASVSANIPSEISSLGNLQVNGVPVSGDIVSGINIGFIAPAGLKTITFEGRTQTISASGVKQATASINASGVNKLDSVSINFISGQSEPDGSAAAVSGSKTTSNFWEFLKRWYLWILGVLVLIFLFVVVFKRLSSNA